MACESTWKEQIFKRYYNELMRQTINARAHLKLWEQLEDYKSSYLKELNQAPHFFTFTMRAHLDDALMTLSRIVRKQKDAFTIWDFLDFVEKNSEIFSNEAFSKREREKPDYDKDWIKSHAPITQKKIEEDKQKLLSLEYTINNLVIWRDKVIAHIDHKFLITGKIISKEHPLQRQQLEEVIDTIVNILNRYSYAYCSSTDSENIPGEDDVQSIMDFIRFYIQEQNKQAEETLRKKPHDYR